MADRRYKFRVGEKAIVIADIPDGPEITQPRRGMMDIVDSDYPGRRLPQNIRIYDLGQVNHQALDGTPVWEDHPVLFTPSYSTSAIDGGEPGISSWFAGVLYTVQPFTDSHYQAFTDRMFNYPVTEWTRRYKRIVEPRDLSEDFNTDLRISLADSATAAFNEIFLPHVEIERTAMGGGYDAAKEAALSAYRWVWDRDKNEVIQRDMDELSSNILPYTTGHEQYYGGYFPFSTGRKSTYKLTATNDPGAADVGTILPTGPVDIFLMPQIGFFMAVAMSADFISSEVMGLCYQVQPRHLYPGYVDPEGVSLSEGSNANYDDADVADFISYQKARSGVQASSWSYTGAFVDGDLSYTEGSMSPSGWTGLPQYCFAMRSSPHQALAIFTSQSWGGGFAGTSAISYGTAAQAESSGFYSKEFFQPTPGTPFLTAVIKIHGQFYYCWDMGVVDDFSDHWVRTVFQNDRCILARGVAWDPVILIGVPPNTYDGTKGDFFL